MLSETLMEGLEQYRIGAKVRALRKAKALGLAQLGAHSGLSPGMLSKIERGQLVPTLPTLLRIALVFGVGLEHFFEPAERPAMSVVRRKDRVRLPDRPGEANPPYWFESLDFPATERLMDAYFAEFPAGAPCSQPHRHAGAEFVFVLGGLLAVEVEETRVELAEGDALYFDSGAPHAYGAAGQEGSSALVVVSQGRARGGGGQRV